MDNNKLLTTLEGVGSLQLSKDFSTQFRMASPFLQQKEKYICSTSNMRHLFVVGEFVVVSHLKIFPLQLLGPADKPMAGPSSSKGKILR